MVSAPFRSIHSIATCLSDPGAVSTAHKERTQVVSEDDGRRPVDLMPTLIVTKPDCFDL